MEKQSCRQISQCPQVIRLYVDELNEFKNLLRTAKEKLDALRKASQ